MANEAVSSEEVETHLERVLASATFRAAERSRRLLRFIVEETLEGRSDRLKDYTLGAEALGRGDDFDPRTDPIARVEASRLRSRLDMYYATDGRSDAVRIIVPKGGYVPVFEKRAPAASREDEGAHSDTTAATATAAAGADTARWSGIWVTVAAAALAAAAFAATATWWFVRSSDAASGGPEVRLELTTPGTTDPASLALSPDGHSIAFVASERGVSKLWVRSLSQSAARPLGGTEYASWPFWSPDGRNLGFFADGNVKAIDLQTGVVRTLSTAPVPAGGAWSTEGVILHSLVPDSPLFRTTTRGGPLEPATQLAPGQTGHRGPAFLPDGRHFLFFAEGNAAAKGVYVGELDSSVTRRLLDADAAAVYAPPQHILYVQNSTLFAQRFDTASATVLGNPSAVAEHLSTEPNAGLPAVSSSSSGVIAYRTGSIGPQRQFIWVDRRGREIERIGVPEERGPSYGSMAPDGRRLAVQRASAGNTDIWLVDLERGPSVRFTTEPQADIAPVWSPRGDRIVYSSQVAGVFELFEKPLNRGAPRLLLRTGQAKQVTDWSRDGHYLLYRSVATAPNPDMDLWALALEPGSTPFAVMRTPFEERDAQFSPDGNWVAYQSNESGQPEIYLLPFKREGERLRLSTSGGVHARWRADGRELFYLTPEGQLMALPFVRSDDGRSFRPGAAAVMFRPSLGAIQGSALHGYFVSPDGERVLIDAIVEQQPPAISLILNWKGPAKE